MKYYIDFEFDGHNGPVISGALIREDGKAVYCASYHDPFDPWVKQNVMPHIAKFIPATMIFCGANHFGTYFRDLIGYDQFAVIIADSPVDIGRFCNHISTDGYGNWQSTDYAFMQFEVHNVNCYPTKLEGAIQHHAYWDAMALREKLNG